MLLAKSGDSAEGREVCVGAAQCEVSMSGFVAKSDFLWCFGAPGETAARQARIPWEGMEQSTCLIAVGLALSGGRLLPQSTTRGWLYGKRCC